VKRRIQLEIERGTSSRPTVLSFKVQDGWNMTGTNCDLFTHKSSRLYLNYLNYEYILIV
jgi:hypothetical protein